MVIFSFLWPMKLTFNTFFENLWSFLRNFSKTEIEKSKIDPPEDFCEFSEAPLSKQNR